MAYSQGDIFSFSIRSIGHSRPALVVSNKHRPFQGQQYTFAVITTTQRSEAVEIATSDLEQGKLHQLPSYGNPWSLHEIDHGDIHKRVAELSKTKQKEVATEIKQFVSVP